MVGREPISITSLINSARSLGVSIDSPLEEIERAYESFERRGLAPSLSYPLEIMKERKNCRECKSLGASRYMCALEQNGVSEHIFCGYKCRNAYKLRIDSTIQQIATQLQQKGINRVEDLGDSLVEIQALFPYNCQCEHP
jgi:hypothetical protein